MRYFAVSLATLIALSVSAPITFAQDSPTAVDPAADAAALEAKWKAVPELDGYFNRMKEIARERNADHFRAIMLSELGMDSDANSDLSIDLDILPLIQPAAARARAIGELLAADLDGDWQISKQELRSVLKIGSNPAAAEAFFNYDLNENDTLEQEEIKAAAARRSDKYGGRRSDRQILLLEAFDFDGDRVVTSAEIERAAKALQL
ncbi:hypothetical protein [Neogemmobacter tilapiae]|uniref:EF-hand domain-containing protein n=1 Tax=Neogemmobacter tilapiae TaxID=875041 RepID=A0A918TNG0_9RHOB|nr:hypothetical protein [Gemmobacter tilapiae]GHC55494.1 hypothetical protein GCM10007315_18060 [Gemmobacter tilapiae]